MLEEYQRAKSAARKSTRKSSAMARPATVTTWSPRQAKAQRAACKWRCAISTDLSITSTRTAPRRRSAIVEGMEAVRAVFGVGRRSFPAPSPHRPLPGRRGVQEAIYSILMLNNGFICEKRAH